MLSYFFMKSKIAELERKVESQATTFSNLKQECARLERLKEEQKQVKSAHRGAPLAVDFDSMDAFSVERINKNGVDITVIGYWAPGETEKQVAEWTLNCNDTIHAELVKQFETYIATKYTK